MENDFRESEILPTNFHFVKNLGLNVTLCHLWWDFLSFPKFNCNIAISLGPKNQYHILALTRTETFIKGWGRVAKSCRPSSKPEIYGITFPHFNTM